MADRFRLNPEKHDSNLTDEERWTLETIFTMYGPDLPHDQRAKLLEQVDIFVTNATGKAYIMGWGQGKQDAEEKTTTGGKEAS